MSYKFSAYSHPAKRLLFISVASTSLALGRKNKTNSVLCKKSPLAATDWITKGGGGTTNGIGNRLRANSRNGDESFALLTKAPQDIKCMFIVTDLNTTTAALYLAECLVVDEAFDRDLKRELKDYHRNYKKETLIYNPRDDPQVRQIFRPPRSRSGRKHRTPSYAELFTAQCVRQQQQQPPA
ncbi:unnamed protein product [Phytophthora lilii]|uniref:Unnamed protein product n=1 Tax=Phytophthora lilii TaxID=2077276 RepID=A0A9W6WGF6_9STRA|nr:unnamed protein product [Phytophthora lilii]